MSGGRQVIAYGWRQLGSELVLQRRALPGLLGCAFLAALPALLSGRLVATAVDHGFLAGRSDVGMAWLSGYAMAILVAAIGARQVPIRLGLVVEPLRDRLVRRVVHAALRQAVAGHPDRDAGTVARLTKQVETVRDSTAGLLMGLQQVVFTVAAAIVGLFWLAPLVAVLVLAPVVLTLLLLGRLLVMLVDRQQEVLVADEQVAASVSGLAATVRDVVACGGQDRAGAEIGADIDRQARATRAITRAGALRSAVGSTGGRLPLLVILLAGPWLIRSGQLSVGGMLGAITYITTSLQPALRSAVQSVGGSSTLLSVTLHRLATTSASPVAQRPAPAGPPIESFDLTADRLSFAYGTHAEPIVSDLELTVRHGEHLTLVGSSGVGKSTLASLLVGLTPPQQGTVSIGGVPLAEIGEARLRRMVTLIPQESYVFTGTLRENLTYLSPGATEAELDKAVDAVGLTPLVDRLNGYDAMVGPGLTAGERQLISLVRAWLSPAEIVVLDEATCHLHPAAEARAEHAFRERPGTLIVIAHRMSSALRADRILLMDGSRPVLGSHQELLLRSRQYAELIGHWHDVTEEESKCGTSS
ncbi:MAG: ATP-binding cassette, subfamily bacterial RamB/AmfA [Pseudonocardiales bacterium]|nr:ATP-binding cassette, subfamily bacterial RamB/AmfA [Pseudonocardiales bacterium]